MQSGFVLYEMSAKDREFFGEQAIVFPTDFNGQDSSSRQF